LRRYSPSRNKRVSFTALLIYKAKLDEHVDDECGVNRAVEQKDRFRHGRGGFLKRAWKEVSRKGAS
jgi:hypothetical protein